MPPDDGHYDISIAVIGAAIPDRVQLFAGGINGPPEYAEGAASGTGHPDGRDHTPVSLIVTTRNPSCTAVFLSSYDVTRHSDVQAGYMYPDDLGNGVNMVFGAHADEAYDLVPLLVERPAISSAAVYSTGAPTELLAQDVNPDVYVNPVEMAWREFARSLARAVGLDAYARGRPRPVRNIRIAALERGERAPGRRLGRCRLCAAVEIGACWYPHGRYCAVRRHT